MNIFILHTDPTEAASMHCDRHVVKMHVEGIQMLVSVLDRHNINHKVTTKRGTIHKGGYANHPCTRWAGDNWSNFMWLVEYTEALIEEHTYRYGTVPHSKNQLEEVMYAYWENYSLIRPIYDDLTPFAQAMPDAYKNVDAVTAYRDYYINEKADIAVWNKTRPAPKWYTDAMEAMVSPII
jgi:hypothetical protein